MSPLFRPKPRMDDTPLRVLAERRGLRLGTAVSAAPLRDDAAYRETVAREFNLVTCENAMKFRPLRPARDRFDFADADAILAFAQEHDMAVRGHVLLWHEEEPAWFDALERDEALEALREHVQTVARRYRGKLIAWDVVNEAIGDDARPRDAWYRGILGDDCVRYLFEWAHVADPETKLFYNDYAADGINAKSDAIYAMVRDLLRHGVPIHGVGFQMHVGPTLVPDPESVARNIRRFNDLGLEVHLTEMDYRLKLPASRAAREAQARYFGDIVRVCREARDCTVLTVWGVSDNLSWIPHRFPGEGEGLLFDAQYRPKATYRALQQALGTDKRPGPQE